MIGRPIRDKQMAYHFFRPSAYTVGNTIADFPFSFVRFLLFAIELYFMSGLHRSAEAFFTFFLFIYGVS